MVFAGFLTTAEAGPRILFVGNSFTFGANSAVRHYRADTVHDLNGGDIGGVPALFRRMCEEAGLDYDVSLETLAGADLARHWNERRSVIDKPWDVVVLQSHSVLDPKAPGNPTRLVDSAQTIGSALTARNPGVALYLTATWARADLVYDKPSPWHGEPLDRMTTDIRSGYDAARAAMARATVLPVGDAWQLAMTEEVADANPYDGTEFNKVDLWGWDHYHASTYGYYLEALVTFGAITGKDPRQLGAQEKCADDLGISPDQAAALQRVAADALSAEAVTAKVATAGGEAIPLR
ncbi:hypothetical protein GCM10008942_28790 [Rhizomicrobium electricum]|uniref:PEP-CTERM sorting domain-containing protein n=2 Tax=Rhizomicrobium electricum TaxID=480070 RepID=A0ABN1EZ27_9PROT